MPTATQEAPGRSHREGFTLVDLFEKFPNDEAAEHWFEAHRWGETGIYCPRCGDFEQVKETPERKPLPYWCGACRRHFSVRVGSPMERSKVPLQKWAIALYLHLSNLKGVSSMKLHRDLGVTQKTAWFMLHRIHEGYDSEPSFA